MSVRSFFARAASFAVLSSVLAVPGMSVASSSGMNDTPPTAAAAPTDGAASFKQGLLTVRPSGSVDADVTCDAGLVEVADVQTPTGLQCAKVKELKAIGTAGGDDFVTEDMTAIDFPNLGPITLDGRGGDDRFFIGDLKETIIGGPGSGDDVQLDPFALSKITDTKVDGIGPPDPISGIELAYLPGTAGNDILDASGFSGEAKIHAAAGDDTLIGGKGDDEMRGQNGSDTYQGSGGADYMDDVTFDDLEGDDSFEGGSGMDKALDAGTANMTVSSTQILGAGTNSITGVEDVYAQTTGIASDIDASAFPGLSTLIAQGTGSNEFDASLGGSTMLTEAGADILNGGPGHDIASALEVPTATFTPAGMTSAQGNDTYASIDELAISGASGTITIDTTAFSGPVQVSASGNATITTGPGDDYIGIYWGNADGGAGTDEIQNQAMNGTTMLLTDGGLAGSVTPLTIANIEHYSGWVIGEGTLNMTAWSGTTLIYGDNMDQTLIGSPQRDLLYGLEGNDDLRGSSGNDRMFGGDGNDDLSGGPGQDFCKGGAGNDHLLSCEKGKA